MMTNLEELFKSTQTAATKLFDEHGEIHPMWRAENSLGETFIICTPFGNAREKEALIEGMKRMFIEKNIVRYALIVEAWFKAFPKDFNPDNIPGPIRNMPDKKEAVFISAEDRDTGETMMVTLEIDRSGEKPKLITSEPITQPGGGLMSNLFDHNRTVQ